MTNLTIVVVIQLLVIAYGIWAILELNSRSRDERKELEDRLMAICQPIPLTHVMATRTESQNDITYVDEEADTARKKVKTHET